MSRMKYTLATFLVLLPAESLHAFDTERFIANSDDLDRYKEVFAQAAIELVNNGTCSGLDFIEHGGWVRSTSNKSGHIYFMYCGGISIANRLYLDATTGEIFR